VERKLSKQVEMLRERGDDIFPMTTFDRIRKNGGRLPAGVADRVRRRGAVIVRNVVPKGEAEDMLTDLTKYMFTNNNVFPNTNRVRANVDGNKNRIVW
jgi:hypothetical protein